MQCLKLKVIVEGEVQFSICHTDNKDSRWNDERLTADCPYSTLIIDHAKRCGLARIARIASCIQLSHWFATKNVLLYGLHVWCLVYCFMLSGLSDLSVCCVREIAGICAQGDALEWKWTRRTSLSISVLVLTELPSYQARVCTGNIYIKTKRLRAMCSSSAQDCTDAARIRPAWQIWEAHIWKMLEGTNEI